MDVREYLCVVADFLPDGSVRPVSVRLADGPAYAVSRVISVVDLASTGGGGSGFRFRVIVGGRVDDLFFEVSVGRKASRWYR